jgi:MoaD family protein
MSGFVRDVTRGKTEAEVTARDVAGCLAELEVLFPGIKEQLFDEEGDLHPFVDVFVNGDNVQHLQGLATQLADGDEVSILPAFAGG